MTSKRPLKAEKGKHLVLVKRGSLRGSMVKLKGKNLNEVAVPN